MPRPLIAVVALALVVAGGAAAIDAAETQAGDRHEFTNETFTPSTGNFVDLNQSQLDVRYDPVEEIVVYNESNVRMFPGDDFAWAQSNGTVKALSGGRLVGDNSATISYGFNRPTQQQEDIAALFGNSMEIYGLLLFVVTVLAILAALRSFA